MLLFAVFVNELSDVCKKMIKLSLEAKEKLIRVKSLYSRYQQFFSLFYHKTRFSYLKSKGGVGTALSCYKEFVLIPLQLTGLLSIPVFFSLSL